MAIFVNFVHTDFGSDAIIILVKPPNTLYSFCYTPLEEIPSPKRAASDGCSLSLLEKEQQNLEKQ